MSLDKRHFDNFRKKITEHKQTVLDIIRDKKEELLTRYSKKHPRSLFLKGNKYENDEEILDTMLENIYNECGCDYKKAIARFLSLDSVEILLYIERAVVDSTKLCHYRYL